MKTSKTHWTTWAATAIAVYLLCAWGYSIATYESGARKELDRAGKAFEAFEPQSN